MIRAYQSCALFLVLLLPSNGFTPRQLQSNQRTISHFTSVSNPSNQIAIPHQPSKSSNTNTALHSSDPRLDEKFGGYTAKQRLREEVESPFRKVRLLFFGFSTGSALLALYFSTLNLFKANAGFASAPPIEETIQNCAINGVGAVVCAALAYRDWQAGRVNLERIAKGGALARLRVVTGERKERTTLGDYRRVSRVLLAAGGEEYLSVLARSLASDQLADENGLVDGLRESDVLLVPVLIDERGAVGDTEACWRGVVEQEGDRNFDIVRADPVTAFPMGNSDWTECLESEFETAKKQGFDVMSKGVTITIKKNGRILRRATGQPRWGDFLGAMDVLDGKFGMPGDGK